MGIFNRNRGYDDSRYDQGSNINDRYNHDDYDNNNTNSSSIGPQNNNIGHSSHTMGNNNMSNGTTNGLDNHHNRTSGYDNNNNSNGTTNGIANHYDRNSGYGNNRHSGYGNNRNSGYDNTRGNGYSNHDDVTNGSSRFGRGRRGRHDEKSHNRKKGTMFDIDSGQFNRRPSFGQWIKFTWLDILTMIAMGAIGLGVYNAKPAPSRSFPVTFQDGEIVYPEFAYPMRHEIIPIWAAALIASLVPIFVILCMQIRIRSFWDVNNAIIGLLYSLITAAVFQVFLKWLIGGLRPHFLAVCDPDPAIITAVGGRGFRNIMFQRNICRGDQNEINDSLESFPSGHSTAAAAGLMFLYFYLNAKLKVFSNFHRPLWTMIALYAPVLGSVLIAGTLTIDEFHNWYDVLAGWIIGAVMALSAYRMVYASVWDFRFNHIPLTRHTPFSYGAGQAGAGGFESAVFTRKGGWGYEEAYGGAPFDAAHGLRGQMAGFNTGATGRHGGGGIMGNKGEKDIENGTGTGAGYNNGTTTTNGTSHHNTGSTGGGGLMSKIMPGHHNNSNNVTSPTTAATRDSTGHHHTGGATTPTRDGKYHQHSRSLERKAIPAVPNNNNNSTTPVPMNNSNQGYSTHGSVTRRDGDF